MMDTTFIRGGLHRRLVTEIYEEATQDPEISGLLLQGSVARGDASTLSELDVYAA